MTTQRILELVNRYPSIRDVNLRLDPDDIIGPASWAQEEILSRVMPIIATGSITTIIGQETYAPAGGAPPELNGWLRGASKILPVGYPTDTTRSHVEKRDVSWVDKDRSRIAEGGSKSLPPRFFYVLNTNPLTIGFWYIPDAVYVFNFRYYRKHYAADNLKTEAAAVNPILPDDCERLLVVKTVAMIFEQLGSRYAQQFKLAYDISEKLIQKKTEMYGALNAAILQDEGVVW